MWDETAENAQQSGQLSPQEREFVILVLDGRAPILTKNDVDVVHLISVNGSAFSCEIGKLTVSMHVCNKVCVDFVNGCIDLLLICRHGE